MRQRDRKWAWDWVSERNQHKILFWLRYFSTLFSNVFCLKCRVYHIIRIIRCIFIYYLVFLNHIFFIFLFFSVPSIFELSRLPASIYRCFMDSGCVLVLTLAAESIKSLVLPRHAEKRLLKSKPIWKSAKKTFWIQFDCRFTDGARNDKTMTRAQKIRELMENTQISSTIVYLMI